MVRQIRTLLVFCLAFALLALNCMAAVPVQLSGTGGQTILSQVASSNITQEVTKASTEEFWNWGTNPLNKVVDSKTGKVVDLSDYPSDDGDTWLATKNQELGGLNLTAW